MLKEEYLQQLLTAVHEKELLNIYDYTAETYPLQTDIFSNTKPWADQLVRDKLAKYAAEDHTVLQLTNYGKYWMLHGGYEAFLKEGQSTKDISKDKDDNKLATLRKEELLEARLRLTHYRLVGFWLMIVISSLGFMLSLYNLYLIMSGRK
jgi:hypothetical protein